MNVRSGGFWLWESGLGVAFFSFGLGSRGLRRLSPASLVDLCSYARRGRRAVEDNRLLAWS